MHGHALHRRLIADRRIRLGRMHGGHFAFGFLDVGGVVLVFGAGI